MDYDSERSRLFSLKEATNTIKADKSAIKSFKLFLAKEGTDYNELKSNNKQLDEVLEKYFMQLKQFNGAEIMNN